MLINHLIKRPIGVLGVLFMLVVPGWWLSTSLPVQLMPEAEIPLLEVEISIPGVPAIEIEQRMMPAFREAVARLEKMTDVHTYCLDGKAILRCEFEWDCSMHHQFDLLSEAITSSSRLFTEAATPLISLPGKTSLPVATIMVSSEVMTLSDLTTWTKTRGINYIEQVPGIAFCEIIGGSNQVPVFTPNYSILHQHDLSLSDLHKRLQEHTSSHFSILSASHGQGIRLNIERRPVSPDSLEKIELRIEEKLFSLGQLGRIRLREEFEDHAASYNGQSSVALRAYQRPGSDLMDLPAQIQDAVGSLSIHFPDIQINIVDDQASWISLSMDGLTSSLITASCLAFCLLFLVIRTWQAPLLMGVTIPISLGLTALAFSVFDIGINMMTLAGLTLGIGVLIDNGIVMVEQLESYQRQGSTPKLAAVRASRNMASPLLSSTMTSVSMFIPIWLIDGKAATLFHDFGLAVTISLITSLLIAIWILPVLSTLIPSQTSKALSPPSDILRPSPDYSRLSWLLLILGGTGLISGITLVPKELFPPISQQSIQIHLNWNQDLSLERNDQLVRRVEQEVFGEWESYGLSGNLSTSDGPLMLRESILSVSIPESQRATLLYSLQDWLKREIPESQFVWSEPDHALVEWIGKRKQDRYCLTPPDGNIYHLVDLVPKVLSDQRSGNLSPGIDLHHYLRTQTILSPNHPSLLHHQLPPSDLASEIQFLSGGRALMNFSSNGSKEGLILRHPSTTSPLPRDFFVQHIPVHDLLHAETTILPEMIQGDLKGPFLRVSNRDAEIEDSEWKSAFQSFLSKEGWDMTQDLRVQEQQKSIEQLLLMFGIGILLLFITLVAQFNSFRFPLIILSTIPFGFAGSFLLLLATGQSLNMISAIGLIIVSGIVVNDAILKASAIRKLVLDDTPIIQAVSIASAQRKRAILLTSATTILAMLPILFSIGAGAELQSPMAVSVIGGITLGTAAAMWWIPAVLLRFPPTK